VAGRADRPDRTDRLDRADRGDPMARFTHTMAEDAGWLVARAALAHEIAAWPELEARFAQHAALGEAIAALDRALAEQADAKAKIERQHKAAAS